MTEAEWLACDDPGRMLLRPLPRGLSERRLRLFACACCRRIWDLMTDKRSRRAVEAAERFADSTLDLAGLEAARRAARQAGRSLANLAAVSITELGFAWWLLPYPGTKSAIPMTRIWAGWAYKVAAAAARARRGQAAAAERAVQCALLRDIVGPRRRAPRLDSSWLAWADGTILQLARAVYDGRAFDRMPILGDALEEAGCTERTMLDHCRQPGEHVRGCWVLDLVLGKK